MKIAHVTATFPPYQGGTGNVCLQNVRSLARRGHEMHVFTGACQDAPALEDIGGARVHRLHPWLQIGNAPFTPALLPELGGFDAIHLHYPFVFGDYLTRVAAAGRRTPLVITFHNDLTGDRRRAGVFTAYMALSARWVVRPAAALCVVSLDHFQSSRLHRVLGDRRPPLFELSNAVDCEHFRPGLETDVRSRYAIPPEAPLMLFVAALDRAHHFKGLDVLLSAFTALPEACWLLIVGDGDLRSHYEQQARLSGVGGRTVFTGAIANAKAPAFYRCADVTVLPSSPPESFGLVLIESLACGTPVIAGDIPGVRTVVSHEVDGLLCPPGDVAGLRACLAAFFDRPCEARRQMGRRGRDKVLARYDEGVMAARLIEIYGQVRAAWTPSG